MTFLNLIFNKLTQLDAKLYKYGFASFFIKATLATPFILHFLVVGFFQFPDNPIKHQYKYEMQGYIEPFFSQSWKLFAPNPINSNMSLLLRFSYNTSTSGIKDTTDWVDITEPIIELHRESNWNAALRLNKFTQSCMADINTHHNMIVKKISETDSLINDTKKSADFYAKAIDASHGHKSLIQYTKFVAYGMFKKPVQDLDDVRVQYKIFNAKFPRFSKRHLDYYNSDYYEYSEVKSSFININ